MYRSIIFTIGSLGDGGAEKAVISLAKGFMQKGYKVHIVALKDHVVYDIPEGVHYTSMNFKKGLGLFRMLTDLKLKRRLRTKLMEIIRAEKVDSIFSSRMFADTLLSSMNLPAPVFYVIQNNLGTKFLETRKGLRKRIKWHKLKKVYNGKNLITVSNGVQEDILHKVQVKPAFIRTVHNPFPHKKIQALAREEINPGMGNYIINVGSFKRQKRHDILLKAFAESGVDCKLVLLGGGSKKTEEQIKTLATDLNIQHKVIMPGFQSNPYAWMNKARLFVMSSDFEGFPLVLVESIISGTPVISTDCPSGPSEILKDQPELLSPVGNVSALAANIKQYTNRPPAVLEHCVQNFFLENIVDELETCIKEII